jgi:putative inorganic carbon (HCO3(-)) transporter
MRQADLKAGLLAAAGVALLATAPGHRVDLLVFGAIAGVAGIAWRPWTGPALIGAALPLYFFARNVGPVSFSPPGMVLLLAWLAVILRAAREWIGRQRPTFCWPSTGYDGPLGLFLMAALLSLLVTEYPLLSARELRALILEPVLLFWLLAVLRPWHGNYCALGGFLAAASVTALAAIAQVSLGLGGTEAEGVRRAQAWYPSPNHLGLMLGRALPFFAALVLVDHPSPLKGRRRFPGLVVGLGVLLTYSLGSWLGALAGTLAVAASLGRRRIALVLGGAAAGGFVLVGLLATAGLLPERLSPLRASSGFRVDLWISSLEMVKDHPILGIGLDNFVYLYQQVYLREGAAAEPNLSHPHNWVLHVWLQLGILGLGAFLWLLWRFARQVRTGLLEPSRRWIAAGALGCMADTLVHGLIDNSYFLVDLAFIFWLTLALAVNRQERSEWRDALSTARG